MSGSPSASAAVTRSVLSHAKPARGPRSESIAAEFEAAAGSAAGSAAGIRRWHPPLASAAGGDAAGGHDAGGPAASKVSAARRPQTSSPAASTAVARQEPARGGDAASRPLRSNVWDQRMLF